MQSSSNKTLITGTAGFIGFHLVKKLLEHGDEVVGIDNINDYYDVQLKYARLAETGIDRTAENWHQRVKSTKHPGYTFIRMNLEDSEALSALFDSEKFDRVINLAAQAGVRYSLENPHTYINSNITGFLNILEGCRYNHIRHLVYASSSSVYGNNTRIPLSTRDHVDHPISLYAATKKSNELMAHTYSHLFGFPVTGLRFFTVYGPWGRPDMALFLFTKAILEDKPIRVFNHGNMVRDFTYVDDIVEGVVRVLDHPPKRDDENTHDPSQSPTAPFKVYNIGNASPVGLMDYIHMIEQQLDREARKEYLPMQAGDVARTEADVKDLIRDIGYKPSTTVEEGIRRFIAWYLRFYEAER